MFDRVLHTSLMQEQSNKILYKARYIQSSKKRVQGDFVVDRKIQTSQNN